MTKPTGGLGYEDYSEVNQPSTTKRYSLYEYSRRHCIILYNNVYN
jgi:hypothetical protein